MGRWLASLLLLLGGCLADPISVRPSNNRQVAVEKLFDYDGCSVYRFWDAAPRYFSKCGASSSSTAWDEPCGKGCVRRMSLDTANVGVGSP